MKINVGENIFELQKKIRKVGGEAPSVRLKVESGETKVVGMMADKIQVFITLANINDFNQGFKDIITEFENRTFFYIVTSSSTSKVFQTINKYDLDKGSISSEFSDFSMKFGVNIEDKMVANSIFIINKDGEFTYIEIPLNISDKLDLDMFKVKLKEAVEFKKKGHTHENWMGV